MAMAQARTIGELTALLATYPADLYVRVQQALSDDDFAILAVAPKRGRDDVVVLLFDLPVD